MSTIQQRLIDALLARGESRVQARTGRYVVFTAKTFGKPEKFFFLGYAGALRFGRSATSSVPCDKLKARLLTQVEVAGQVFSNPQAAMEAL